MINRLFYSNILKNNRNIKCYLNDRNPDDVSLRNAVPGFSVNDRFRIDGYMGENVIIPHNELRKSQPLVLVAVNVDVPVQGFNLLLGFNVHFKGLLCTLNSLVGAGGELSVRALSKNEVNVGLHNLFSFFLTNIQKLCQT